ncbi:hypothetical protein FOMPIDRAFT_86788 [Fomitopsis schrenkii]|uniref:Uncharacterized protein n=1 Tax=Fomitopsis schrenkii TaxID=2126942 RepID=S8G6B3_FOMSC|nr:hypothetical protein FOMPIDRAFT_86788 [Fomitopsis schrenkii]
MSVAVIRKVRPSDKMPRRFVVAPTLNALTPLPLRAGFADTSRTPLGQGAGLEQRAPLLPRYPGGLSPAAIEYVRDRKCLDGPSLSSNRRTRWKPSEPASVSVLQAAGHHPANIRFPPARTEPATSILRPRPASQPPSQPQPKKSNTTTDGLAHQSRHSLRVLSRRNRPPSALGTYLIDPSLPLACGRGRADVAAPSWEAAPIAATHSPVPMG